MPELPIRESAPDTRININEGICWRDAEGREWQAWEVFTEVRAERDRYREVLERMASFPTACNHGPMARRALEGKRDAR